MPKEESHVALFILQNDRHLLQFFFGRGGGGGEEKLASRPSFDVGELVLKPRGLLSSKDGGKVHFRSLTH